MVTTYVGALTIGAYVYSVVLNASNGAHRTLFALSILAVGLCLLIEFLPVASDAWSVVALNLQHRDRTQRKILQELLYKIRQPEPRTGVGSADSPHLHRRSQLSPIASPYIREEAGIHRYNVGIDTLKLCATSCGGVPLANSFLAA
jgi:hypothetical protein